MRVSTYSLDLMIQDNRNREISSVSKINFMLYQLQSLLRGYQDARSTSGPGQRRFRLQGSPGINDQKIQFIESIISHYQSILENYIKSERFSEFDNVDIFLPGISSYLRCSFDILKIRLAYLCIIASKIQSYVPVGASGVHTSTAMSVCVHSIEDARHVPNTQQTSSQGGYRTFIAAELLEREGFANRKVSGISHTDQWLDGEALFEYKHVIGPNLELMIYDKVEGGEDGDEGANADSI